MEEGSISSDNNRDLEGISKPQVDKTNSSFPFTKQNLDNEINEKYVIPSKSVTSPKSTLSTNITDNMENANNVHGKDTNILPKLTTKAKKPYKFRH